MSLLEEKGRALAELAFAAELRFDERAIADDIGKAIGASSTTLEEAYVTALRVLRSHNRGVALLTEAVTARAAALGIDPAEILAAVPAVAAGAAQAPNASQIAAARDDEEELRRKQSRDSWDLEEEARRSRARQEHAAAEEIRLARAREEELARIAQEIARDRAGFEAAESARRDAERAAFQGELDARAAEAAGQLLRAREEAERQERERREILRLAQERIEGERRQLLAERSALEALRRESAAPGETDALAEAQRALGRANARIAQLTAQLAAAPSVPAAALASAAPAAPRPAAQTPREPARASPPGSAPNPARQTAPKPAGAELAAGDPAPAPAAKPSGSDRDRLDFMRGDSIANASALQSQEQADTAPAGQPEGDASRSGDAGAAPGADQLPEKDSSEASAAQHEGSGDDGAGEIADARLDRLRSQRDADPARRGERLFGAQSGSGRAPARALFGPAVPPSQAVKAAAPAKPQGSAPGKTTGEDRDPPPGLAEPAAGYGTAGPGQNDWRELERQGQDRLAKRRARRGDDAGGQQDLGAALRERFRIGTSGAAAAAGDSAASDPPPRAAEG